MPNNFNHFSRLPSIEKQRSVFDRSSSHKTSFNAGELIPVYVDEVLPGDTIEISTSKVVRLQTLLTPIMDNAYLDFYWFFVPNRLVWSHWNEFCGENTGSPWIPQTTYAVPLLKITDAKVQRGSIADYMGIPLVRNKFIANSPIALPFRGYALICDQFFRDQNLTDPLDIPLGDADVTYDPTDTNYITCTARGGNPFKVAKYHDYFTSCLPAPQKGSPVSAPVTGTLPVHTALGVPFSAFEGTGIPMRMFPANGVDTDYRVFSQSSGDAQLKAEQTGIVSYAEYEPANLIAESGAVSSLGIDINGLRLAVQSQRYLEQLARSGSRYTELLKSFFGVSSPDSRLQRPEYLGGNRIRLAVHQVSNTAQTVTDFLGDLGANSVTSDTHADFLKSFTEHGYLFGLCCVRYDHTYGQGIDRMWSRRTFLDYYLPTFSNIGEQPIRKREIYLPDVSSGSTDDASKVFGYNEAWSEYRFKPDRVSSYMRPDITGGLGSWHLADNYASMPSLSDTWIREDKSNLDRTLAVTSASSDQIFADFYFNAKFTRVMPVYSVPGMLDHF